MKLRYTNIPYIVYTFVFVNLDSGYIIFKQNQLPYFHRLFDDWIRKVYFYRNMTKVKFVSNNDNIFQRC